MQKDTLKMSLHHCIAKCTRAKVKATSLVICCIVFNLCVYTAVTAAATKIKEKIAFALV